MREMEKGGVAMSADENRAVVQRLWQLFDAFDFAAAADLLADDFVCEWPQSAERIRGAKNYIALNSAYPGRWRCTVERTVAEGDTVAAEVRLTYGERTERAIGFYELRGGKIARETTYWPEPYAAPASRAQWVEPMEVAWTPSDTSPAVSESQPER